jgi:hypothetical protein
MQLSAALLADDARFSRTANTATEEDYPGPAPSVLRKQHESALAVPALMVSLRRALGTPRASCAPSPPIHWTPLNRLLIILLYSRRVSRAYHGRSVSLSEIARRLEMHYSGVTVSPATSRIACRRRPAGFLKRETFIWKPRTRLLMKLERAGLEENLTRHAGFRGRCSDQVPVV